jgi:hypothetical protein
MIGKRVAECEERGSGNRVRPLGYGYSDNIITGNSVWLAGAAPENQL